MLLQTVKCQQAFRSTTNAPPSPASDASGTGLSLFSRFSFSWELKWLKKRYCYFVQNVKSVVGKIAHFQINAVAEVGCIQSVTNWHSIDENYLVLPNCREPNTKESELHEVQKYRRQGNFTKNLSFGVYIIRHRNLWFCFSSIL